MGNRSTQQLQNHIALTVVDSSKLAAVGYEESTETLAIRFKPNTKRGEAEGAVYHYFGFPPEQWKAFQDAESKGGFFNAHVLHAYDYRKIEPETEDMKVMQNDETEKAPA